MVTGISVRMRSVAELEAYSKLAVINVSSIKYVITSLKEADILLRCQRVRIPVAYKAWLTA
jgi:hypothetical protein